MWHTDLRLKELGIVLPRTGVNPRRIFLATFLGVSVVVALAASSSETDSDATAIRATASQFIEEFYAAGTSPLKCSIQRQVFKVIGPSGAKTCRSTLEEVIPTILNKCTRRESQRESTDRQETRTVSILDRFQETAIVKAAGIDSADYLQMAKINGKWEVVDLLCRPQSGLGDFPEEAEGENQSSREYSSGSERIDRTDSRDRIDK